MNSIVERRLLDAISLARRQNSKRRLVWLVSQLVAYRTSPDYVLMTLRDNMMATYPTADAMLNE